MIVFSVLFALFISEWRNNVNEKKRTATILDNIEAEIKANHLVLKDVLMYHDSVRQNITLAIKQDSIKQVFFPDQKFYLYKVAPNGIMQEYINNIAWEVAKQERISTQIDFELSKSLFVAYKQQSSFEQALYDISDLLNNRNSHKIEHAEETALLFRRAFNELVGREIRLAIVYEHALKQLEADFTSYLELLQEKMG